MKSIDNRCRYHPACTVLQHFIALYVGKVDCNKQSLQAIACVACNRFTCHLCIVWQASLAHKKSRGLFSQRHGLCRYEDNGVVRPIVHRASLVEMVIFLAVLFHQGLRAVSVLHCCTADSIFRHSGVSAVQINTQCIGSSGYMGKPSFARNSSFCFWT